MNSCHGRQLRFLFSDVGACGLQRGFSAWSFVCCAPEERCKTRRHLQNSQLTFSWLSVKISVIDNGNDNNMVI